MQNHHVLSSLSLATLVIVLVIVAGALAYFLRHRSNRQPLEGRHERNIAQDIDSGNEPPDHSPRK